LRKFAMQFPQLFDSHFCAGTLKIAPQNFIFKDGANLTPKKTNLRSLSHKESIIVNKWIHSSLQQKIIEPSTSSWCSSLFPVTKPSIIIDQKEIEQFRCVTP